jgi:exonuclease SbcC
MKPIKLSIQAFGPFANSEEVDFTKLGDSPLFLINGPTGAGKTSILDAICFALYGQTTGNERDGTQMRCDHADLSVLTEVSLEFALANKRFLIRRVPMQARAKKHGDGTTTQPAEAQLREIDGTADGRLIVSKSVGEANEEIKQLIGLGVEQFRQVMVLPQGKFRELLLADSKDREAIFSKLFATHIYKKIENSLKEKAFGIQKAVEHHQSEIKGILQGAEVSSEAELDQELAQLKPQLTEAQGIKAKAEDALKIVQRNKDQTMALNKRFDELAIKESELGIKQTHADAMGAKQNLLDLSLKAKGIYHVYTTKQSEAEKFAKISQQNDLCTVSLTSAKQEHTFAAEQLAKANAAASVLDGLKSEQAELQRHEKQMAELVDARENLRVKKQAANKSKGHFDEKKTSLDSLEQELAEKEQGLVKRVKAIEMLAPEQQALTVLGEKLIERKNLENIRLSIQKTLAQKRQSEDAVATQTIAFEKAKRNAARTELAWHSGQAALLAEELKDDHPCPVCGSKDHPEPAKPSAESELITKQQVEAARALETQARDKMQEAKDDLAQIESTLELWASKLATSEQSLGKYAKQVIDELKQQQKGVQTKVDTLITMKSEKEALERRVSEIKTIQITGRQSLTALDTQRAHDNDILIQARTSTEQLAIQIPEKYRLGDALVKAIEAIGSNIKALMEGQNKAEHTLKGKQTVLDQAISKEKTLLSQLAEQEVQTAAANADWQMDLQKSDFIDLAQFLHARLDDARQSDLKIEVDNYRSSLASLQAVVQQLKLDLADKKRADVDEIEQLLTEETDSFKEKDNIWRDFEARSKSLISVKEKLIKALAANEALNKQYAIFGTLNNVANGATGNKISLQRFVLSVLLDDVLIQASHRLHIMSRGRYQLVRKEDRAKGNKASGLELEVEDGDTGKPRSVATLSGGESFMAALSLALGLSDVVQSYAGGIKLDALFIDEGFGSLDQESLDGAIKVLIDLQASGRMIGIISHVTELKEQMALRLDVTSGKYGSSIATIAA